MAIAAPGAPPAWGHRHSHRTTRQLLLLHQQHVVIVVGLVGLQSCTMSWVCLIAGCHVHVSTEMSISAITPPSSDLCGTCSSGDGMR
jgi:hypothetical protein